MFITREELEQMKVLLPDEYAAIMLAEKKAKESADRLIRATHELHCVLNN